MPTQARSAQSSQVTIGGQPIPEVMSLTELGAGRDLLDVTALDGDGFVARIGTIRRGAPQRLLFNYVPGNAAQNAVKAAYDGGTSVAFTAVAAGPGTLTWTYNAFVTEYGFAPLGVSNAVQIQATLTPDGPVIAS